jgi:hypothetical protein
MALFNLWVIASNIEYRFLQNVPKIYEGKKAYEYSEANPEPEL